MTLEVVIDDRRELRLAAVPHVGPYEQIGESFERLHVAAGSAGLEPGPEAELLAIYYDDPQTTPASALRADAALTIPEAVTLPAGLSEKRLAGGRYARATFVGPYERLPEMWRRLYQEWLPTSGQRLRPVPGYEVYRNTPADVPPAALRTDLYLPIV